MRVEQERRKEKDLTQEKLVQESKLRMPWMKIPEIFLPQTLPFLGSAMLTYPNQSSSRLNPWRSLKKAQKALLVIQVTMMNVWW